MRRLARKLLPLFLALPVLSCAGEETARETSQPGPPAGARQPTVRVTRVATGLDHPWTVQRLGPGQLLVTERDRARLSLVEHGRRHTVAFAGTRAWVSSETGLMGLAVDPQFADNRRVYTCQGWQKGNGGHDVRVIAWHLGKGLRKASRPTTLVSGFPTSSGRHGGCRLLITHNGSLLVGTGDAAIGTNPQDLHSLGGKTLRLDRLTGRPWPDNPFIHSSNRAKRYVQTYGHRNVQGLAERSDGTLWSVEHGPDRNDEVNLLRSGGNYGWNPVPGYNESVPMTDHSLPGPQVEARWSSGYPTLATSGAAWVSGSTWRAYDGTLAVAALKASELVFLKFDAQGHFRWQATPAGLQKYGRLRGVTSLPGGALLVTTDNGGGRDSVLRVEPGSA